MGKHEVIKPKSSSTERVRRHRSEMRAKGYRLAQKWVPDLGDPTVLARIQEECKAVATWERQNPGEVAWMDDLMVRNWESLLE